MLDEKVTAVAETGNSLSALHRHRDSFDLNHSIHLIKPLEA
jgi:hypothetical protein